MLKDENQTWGSFFLEMALLIGIVLFVRYYVFQLFRVSGPSMCPTLNMIDGSCYRSKGEFIFVNEFLYHLLRQDPKRGEIVVFKAPNKDVSYIKRVIGIPGDTVEVIDGKVILTSEGEKTILDEAYLSEQNKGLTRTRGRNTFEVPEGHYLLFGDNRLQSLDARQCFASMGCTADNTPFVTRNRIRGRAEAVIWPPSLVRKLETATY